MFLSLMTGIGIVKCMISRLLSSVYPSVYYVRITMVKDLGVLEPRGGVGDQLETV